MVCFKNEIELWCHRHMSWLLMARWVGFYQQVSEATLNRSSVSLVFATLHGVIFGIWFRNKPNWRGSWSWRTHTHTHAELLHVRVAAMSGTSMDFITCDKKPCTALLVVCYVSMLCVRACVSLFHTHTWDGCMGFFSFFSFFLLPVPIYIFLWKSHYLYRRKRRG